MTSVNFEQTSIIAITRFFLKKWLFIGSFTIFSGLFAVFYSLSLNNQYESFAILSPNQNLSAQKNGISKLNTGLSGLTSLAGINLGSNNQIDTITQAIAIINSLSFFEKWISNDENNLVYLFAVDSWDKNLNKLNIDNLVYDKNINKWLRKPSAFTESKPSIEEAHREFLRNHFSIDQDFKTGLVTMSIKHISPYIAKDWADSIITTINELVRQRDMNISEQQISYLNDQISSTDSKEIREIFFSLIQTEHKNIMLAKANPDYVFQIIESPYVSQYKVSPRRSIICIVITIFGFMFSIVIILFREFIKRLRENK